MLLYITMASACENTQCGWNGSLRGTANMDIRSFGLNFEVNAVIYSERTVQQLERTFEKRYDTMYPCDKKDL